MRQSLDIVGPLLEWWDAGHADLPWRRSKDPYAVWVAEVMLQQTQIATVLPYYERWMERFPAVESLAEASLDEALKLWEGLGYYSRARNLHAAARTIVSEHGGVIPQSATELRRLKGIGPYIAGAIASIAFDQPAAILDGNVIRVFSRLYDLPDDVTGSATRQELWRLAWAMIPTERPGDYNQALMELGQRLCLPARPICHACPLGHLCLARARGTQLERPVRPARKRLPHYNVVAGVIQRHDGRLLIAQRPLDGLLGGLWEFPGGKQEDGETLPAALQREIREELAIEIEAGPLLTIVPHAYTHFRITLYALQAQYVSGEVRDLGVAGHAWVVPDDLDAYAFAATDRRIIAYLRGEAQQLPLFMPDGEAQ